METITQKKHFFSLLVANKPGVLIRISLVFARRGFNIDSIIASESADPDFSVINIVARGDENMFDQMLKQLNKLVDVVHARDRTGEDLIVREVGLFKVRCEADKRSEIIQLAGAYKCEIVDLSEHSIVLELSGRTERLDSVIRIFSSFGIIELVRTGKIFMARGEELTS